MREYEIEVRFVRNILADTEMEARQRALDVLLASDFEYAETEVLDAVDVDEYGEDEDGQ